MRKTRIIKKIVALGFMGVLAMSMVVTPASAKKKKAAEVDLNGTYHAALGLQTSDTLWICNMRYYEKTNNEYYGTDNEKKLVSKDGSTIVTHDGTYTDAEIAGNGTYTVKLEDADFAGETGLSQLQIATDIPLNDTIKFSNVTATVDGEEFVTFDEAIMEDEVKYLKGGMVVLVINHWRPELVSKTKELGKSEDATNGGYNLLTGQGGESIEVTFTVSGFAYDNEAAVAPAETEATSSQDLATSQTTSTDSSNDAGGSTSPAVQIAMVIAVVVVAGVVVVVKKRR